MRFLIFFSALMLLSFRATAQQTAEWEYQSGSVNGKIVHLSKVADSKGNLLQIICSSDPKSGERDMVLDLQTQKPLSEKESFRLASDGFPVIQINIDNRSLGDLPVLIGSSEGKAHATLKTSHMQSTQLVRRGLNKLGSLDAKPYPNGMLSKIVKEISESKTTLSIVILSERKRFYAAEFNYTSSNPVKAVFGGCDLVKNPL